MDTYGSEEHGYSEEDEEQDPEEDPEEEEEERDEVRSRTSSAQRSSASVTRSRSGKHGPRHSSSKGEYSKTRSPTSEAGSASGREKEKDKKRPRGNLPQAPIFTGDKRTDPKCFKKYVNKVDSYVELARKIIDDGEIGLRLHAALDGDAADYLEDVPANTFGGVDGWRILLRVLRDKFDETRQHKIGSAMKGFFKLQVGNCTLREAADALDRAHRQCRDSGLTIPDSIMIHFYFEHTGMGQDKQANLLLRTNGEYDWKKIKQAVDLLYPNVMVRSGREFTSYKGHGKHRGAHEAHHEWAERSEPSSPLAWDASDEQVESWIYDHDPIEALADVELHEGIPEDISRELHSCFTTHRENRMKLAKAVQARGYYVASKGKGKKGSKSSSKGGKSSGGKSSGGGKGKGKARNGMSLAELKAVTTCADCEQVGHWKGDPECPHSKRKTHEATRDEDAEQYDDEDYHWDDQYWSPSFDGQERNAYQARRNKTPPTAAPYAAARPSSSSRPTVATASHEDDVREVTRAVNSMRQKATATKSKPKPVDPGDVRRAIKKEVESDDFIAGVKNVKDLIEAKKENLISSSEAPTSVAEAVRHYQPPTYDTLGSAWALVRESNDGPDVETLRTSSRRSFMVRKVHWEGEDEPEMIPDIVMSRQVDAMTRKARTVLDGKSYITIDTACENTCSVWHGQPAPHHSAVLCGVQHRAEGRGRG